MSKIKVLIVAGTMHVGGIENQLMHLLRNADKDKYQLDFTSTNPNAYYRKEIETIGGRFIEINGMNHNNPFPYCKQMYSLMRDGKYDIVHSHELFHSGITLLIARLAGVKSRIAHAHNWKEGNGNYSVSRKIYHTAMRLSLNMNSTLKIACSKYAGQFLYGKSATKKKNYHLVYNSVDTTKFLDSDLSKTEFRSEEWINVINVARITAVKNQQLLLEIAKEFKKNHDQIRILCAGNGEKWLIDYLNQEIEKNQLMDYFKLIGVRDDIPQLMNDSSAFVLPSLYEGMPLVLIEAQASGLPCVVADTFSHEVDFDIGSVIWEKLNETPKQWAEEIRKAVRMGKFEKELIKAAIQKKHFDSRDFAKTICNLYDEEYARVTKKD